MHYLYKIMQTIILYINTFVSYLFIKKSHLLKIFFKLNKTY